MTIDELLAQFPAVPNIDDYSSPEEYLYDAMMASRWFLDNADEIRQALQVAAKEWIGSADALAIAAQHGVVVSKAALWKAAVDRGYIDYRNVNGRHLYDRASVVQWATTRHYHQAGPKSDG